MIQDKGIEKVIKSTGQKVVTTGQMLYMDNEGWMIEVTWADGFKGWYHEHELQDISNSK